MDIEAQAETLKRIAGKKIITVSSGKGGVGKTTVAVNVALATSDMGKRTLLIDADFPLGNADIILGVVPKVHIRHYIEGSKSFDEVRVEVDSLSFIPASSGSDRLSILPEGKLERIIHDIRMSNFDFIFIDTQAGIGSNVIWFNSISSLAMIVVNPEPASIMDAYALIKTLRRRRITKDISVVCNMASEREAHAAFTTLERAVGKFLGMSASFMGSIPRDERVFLSFRIQKPLVKAFPQSPASESVRKIAQALVKG